MPEILQDRISTRENEMKKWFIIVVVICVIFSIVYINKKQDANSVQNKSKVEKNKVEKNKVENNKAERESQVQLDYDNKELVQQMMDIVGCSDRSAASMLRSIESCTESNIASIEQVDCDSTIELKVIDESGNVYYAYKGHSYIISSIYKDKDKDGGERIFHMIE